MDKKITIELLVAPGCASGQAAREMVEKAVVAQGVDAAITETVVSSLAQARDMQFLGSPTIRINGIDIEPGAVQRTDYSTS